jgi:hypothetical protein
MPLHEYLDQLESYYEELRNCYQQIMDSNSTTHLSQQSISFCGYALTTSHSKLDE